MKPSEALGRDSEARQWGSEKSRETRERVSWFKDKRGFEVRGPHVNLARGKLKVWLGALSGLIRVSITRFNEFYFHILIRN